MIEDPGSRAEANVGMLASSSPSRTTSRRKSWTGTFGTSAGAGGGGDAGGPGGDPVRGTRSRAEANVGMLASSVLDEEVLDGDVRNEYDPNKYNN